MRKLYVAYDPEFDVWIGIDYDSDKFNQLSYIESNENASHFYKLFHNKNGKWASLIVFKKSIREVAYLLKAYIEAMKNPEAKAKAEKQLSLLWFAGPNNAANAYRDTTFGGNKKR